MEKESIKILVTGDFAPRLRVNEAIKRGDYESLFGELLRDIKNADISITNLESPLCDTATPIKKTGPNLMAPTKSIEALKYAGFDMVTLANNHIMDQGEEGLRTTIETCHKAGIDYLGAGMNLDEAKRLKVVNCKDKKIAFINCCENEWSTTLGVKPGANPLGEIGLFYQIQEAKKESDYTIMIIHGGHETYKLPSPRMKKLYRWFIDLGVDAVIGHHTHCFSGCELYNGKPIVYSLGNFIFDGKSRTTSWNVGAAVMLEIFGDNIDYELLPYTQCDDRVGVHMLENDKKIEWINREEAKTELIQDDIKLESEFEKFVKKQERLYRSYLEPKSCSLIIAAKNRGLLPRRVRGYKELLYQNIIRAEAHRDILLKLLSR